MGSGFGDWYRFNNPTFKIRTFLAPSGGTEGRGPLSTFIKLRVGWQESKLVKALAAEKAEAKTAYETSTTLFGQEKDKDVKAIFEMNKKLGHLTPHPSSRTLKL